MIVGGGPTGVELAGALAEIARQTLRDEFRAIDTARTRIVLIEAGERSSRRFRRSCASGARGRWRRLGVEVRERTRVTGIDAHGVLLGGGAADGRHRPVGGGRRGVAARCARSARRSIAPDACWCEPDLSVPGHPEVFVVGDAAAAVGPGREAAAGRRAGRDAGSGLCGPTILSRIRGA